MILQKDIICMKYADINGINGAKLMDFSNVFHYPFDSNVINIFQTKSISLLSSIQTYKYDDILCKFVVTIFYDCHIFISLQHTLPDSI